MFQPGKKLKRQGSEPRCSRLDQLLEPVKAHSGAESFATTGRSFAATDCTTIAFVPQLVQEESCKFSFVSSTLTEGCDLITQSVEYAPFKRRCVGSNPTGVINRLVVQWTEQLGSNEKVLGSNPSKAESPPLAQWTEHDVTNVGCRKFESCMGVQLPLAQLVAQVPYKNKVERSSRSRKKFVS